MVCFNYDSSPDIFQLSAEQNSKQTSLIDKHEQYPKIMNYLFKKANYYSIYDETEMYLITICVAFSLFLYCFLVCIDCWWAIVHGVLTLLNNAHYMFRVLNFIFFVLCFLLLSFIIRTLYSQPDQFGITDSVSTTQGSNWWGVGGMGFLTWQYGLFIQHVCYLH